MIATIFIFYGRISYMLIYLSIYFAIEWNIDTLNEYVFLLDSFRTITLLLTTSVVVLMIKYLISKTQKSLIISLYLIGTYIEFCYLLSGFSSVNNYDYFLLNNQKFILISYIIYFLIIVYLIEVKKFNLKLFKKQV